MNIEELKLRALQGDDSACCERSNVIRIAPPEVKLSK